MESVAQALAPAPNNICDVMYVYPLSAHLHSSPHFCSSLLISFRSTMTKPTKLHSFFPFFSVVFAPMALQEVERAYVFPLTPPVLLPPLVL